MPTGISCDVSRPAPIAPDKVAESVVDAPDLGQLFLFDSSPRENSNGEIVQELEALKHSPIFAGLSQAELQHERREMDACHFTPGELVVCEKGATPYFHTILQGHVEFLVPDGKGGEIVVGEAGPGGFFGELSILCSEPTLIKIRARDEVSTLALDPGEFKDFVAAHPSVAFDVLRDAAPRLAHIDRLLRDTISKNPVLEADKKLTFGQRIADKFAETMGSWRFILTQAGLLGGWIAWNCIPGLPHFDPYPFIFLNLALSCQAAFAAPVIMMSQNRQAAQDRIEANIDHEVNVKSEVGIGLILKRLDDLQAQVHELQAGPKREPRLAIAA